MLLRITRDDTSDVDPVLVVAGSLDLTSRDKLADAVQELLRTDGCRSLTVDLAAVDFVDSTGLGALVTARNDAEDAEIDLVLRAPSDRVRRILDVTGLLDVFTVTVG